MNEHQWNNNRKECEFLWFDEYQWWMAYEFGLKTFSSNFARVLIVISGQKIDHMVTLH